MRLNRYLIILIIIVGATSLFRTIAVAQKQTLTHDEGISYLAATCHQALYAQATDGPLVGQWRPAAEWKKFIQPDKAFCFQTISVDLAYRDIHPPLYFWLLHLWLLTFGVNHWAGPALNIFLASLTTLAVFGLARTVLRNKAEAILVTFTWALSPATILIASEARQYDLLALITVLLVWQTIRFWTSKASLSALNLSLLTVLTAAGLLTHYYFVFVVGGCVIFLIVKLRHKQFRYLISGLAAIGVGGVLAIVLHPHFLVSFQRYNPQQEFIYTEFLKRAQVVSLSFSSFFYVDAILVGVLVWILITYFRNRQYLVRYLQKTDLDGLYILFFLVWLACITIGLYLAFFSPQSAMSPKYLSLVWPFFAFVPVFLLRFIKRFRTHLAVFFYVCPLLLTGATLVDLNNERTLNIPLDQAEFVVVDNLARGILPRILWHIPDDALIFVDTQDNLLKKPQAWLPSLSHQSVYVSHLAYGNELQHTKATLEIIDQSYDFTVVEEGIWDIGYIIKIEAPEE